MGFVATLHSSKSSTIMGLPISGSANITLLDFNILYDISGASPAIVLTNKSVGPSLQLCSWWVTGYSPSNTPIHLGSQGMPDFPTQNWATYTIPDQWPTPLSEGLCAQVEFSCSTPYMFTLFVQDASGAVYSFAIATPICAPNGNTQNTCGNWGAALFTLQVVCNQAQISAQDNTNYIYNGIPPLTAASQNWVMTYPLGASGNPIPNATATNTASVNFPVFYVGEGYGMYLNTICSYVFGEATIKIQYKSQNALNPQFNIQKTSFAVWCNIDTCKLQCEVAKYVKRVKRNCNTIENQQYQQNLTLINALYLLVLDGIIHPLCGTDVTGYIKEIQRLGEFDCDCCNKYAPGVNLSNLVPTNGTGGCCPTDSNIINKNSGISPTNCATGGYFPANVYDPSNTTVIGNATDVASLISILNNNPAWEAYGTAFNMGNCQVGWYALNSGTIIPVINIVSTGSGTIIPSTTAVGTLVQVGTTTPPVNCPGGNPYPLRVYAPGSTTVIIGIANNITDVVNLLNTTPAWETFGTASVQDSCHVQWNLTSGAIIPPSIGTDTNTTTSTCVGGTQLYIVDMVDVCYPNTPITAASFPCNVSVNFGLGAGFVPLGQVANNAALVAALNAAASKPASVTFTATPVVGQIKVTNTNCTAYSGTITIQCDAGSSSFLLFGANHTDEIGSATPTLNGLYGIGLSDMALIGRIPGTATQPVPGRMWHNIKIGNYLIATEPNTGKVYFWDITNPLNPVLVQTIQLTTIASGNFTGNPHSANNYCDVLNTTPSWYSLYFPTDYYAPMSLASIYVFEAVTGCAWQINFFTGGVVAAFQSNLLLGKCPRVLTGNTIYFTQDGSLEQDASLSSGVTTGNCLQLLLSVGFNSGALAQLTVFSNTLDSVWAASYDAVTSLIYFTGQGASVATYNTTTLTLTHQYINVIAASFVHRLNSAYFNGLLFWTCTQTGGFEPVMSLAVSSLGGTPAIVQFQTIPGEISLGKPHNFLPLGNCLGVLTTNHQSLSTGVCINGIVALYNINGTYIGQINLSTVQTFYNLIPIPNISNYVPTNMS